MTSAWVLIIASVLHFGVRRSCFLNIEQMPLLPDTLFARHIAYCAVLHFLYDQDLLPTRYRRRMGLLIGFIVELVLGVAFMEVLGQWLWFRVEHMVHRCLLLSLRLYGGLNPELCQYLEKAFMRGFMTSLAGLLWLNAYAATEPVEPQAAGHLTSGNARLKHRHLAKRHEQAARRNSIKDQDLSTQEDQKQKLKLRLKQKMKLRLKQKAEQNRKQLEQEKLEKLEKDKRQELEPEQQKKQQQQEQKKQAKNPELPTAEEEAKLSASLEEQLEHLTASDC